MHITERVYGSGVAFEKNLDKSVLQTIQRAPGLPSSHILVDTFLGRADKIGIEDVLNCKYGIKLSRKRYNNKVPIFSTVVPGLLRL